MLPKNAIYIIQGELNHVVAALRRSNRWSGAHFHQEDEQDPLINSFIQLKETLQETKDINSLDTNVFLGPFLDVIRSEDTTGPITGVALSSVNKFLSYGLLDPLSESASSGIDNLADAVTHARFVGTDTSSDEVVLMKILQVLRSLLLSPVGVHMTNESVCEIMQSCFRICFEMRLSELLRRSAEQTLTDMVQLLFLRLPQFNEDSKSILSSPHIRKMFKRTVPTSGSRKNRAKPKMRQSKSMTTVNTTSPSNKNGSEDEKELSKIETKHSHSDTEVVSDSSECKTMVELEPSAADEMTFLKKLHSQNSREIDTTAVVENTLSDSTEVMKSIEDINQACDLQLESTLSMEIPDGQVKSKSCDSNKNLQNFEDHGVISLQYPDESDPMVADDEVASPVQITSTILKTEETNNQDYVNTQGVRFTSHDKEGMGPLLPYGLPCVRELLRFLTSLINPNDRHNTNTMIHIGLSLIIVALESGASHIGHFASLLHIVKDDLCKNLFSLLQCDIHILFSLSMRVCFLLFEALRQNLKFQNERFFLKLMEILSIENLNVPYEKREMALEYVNQLFHIDGLVQELYVNFDCDLHCANILEDLCKTLSKNAFRPGNLSSVNFLSLDALLTIINEFEAHCKDIKGNHQDEKNSAVDFIVEYESEVDDVDHSIGCTALSTSGYATGQRFLGINASVPSKDYKTDSFSGNLPSREEISAKKIRKKLLSHGIDEFNKKPKSGIDYLQEHGLLSANFLPQDLIVYLKENPRVDKKTLGDFIGTRKNAEYLKAFVGSFAMKNLRIDEALRNFLESFRLPGESPVISLILEEFSSVYFNNNPVPYKNTDAAFTMAYAVIMLNVDQHNKNVKQQKSMNLDDFKRNLRKTNGGEDFPAELLEEIFENIRTNEIVMPSERIGKVKEAYEWKVLMQKCEGPDSHYLQVKSALYDEELFLVVWGPTVAALSYIYDNGSDKVHIQKALAGFKKCAVISAHYELSDVFDNLLISLCKFTSLLVTSQLNDNLSVVFGNNLKSQLSMRTVFVLAHKQGDMLREGWQNLLVCLMQLFKGKLLPPSLTEVEDFVEQSGKISLIKEEAQPVAKQDNTGVFAAFYSYMVANPDTPAKSVLSAEDRQSQEAALNCIKECHPENIITESKFLRPESLQELVKSLIIASKPLHLYESTDVPYDEDAAVFFLEFLIKVALQNKDRISLLWHALREHLSNIIISAPKVSFLVERAVVGLLRIAIRLLGRDEISSQILITLRILLMMHPKVLLSCSKQILYGLHELLRTNAVNLRYSRDWITILTILQVVGAGAIPPIVKPGVSLTLVSGDIYSVLQEEKIDTETGEFYSNSIEQIDRGYVADVKENTYSMKHQNEQWLLINKNEDEGLPINQYELKFKEKLNKHNCKVFIKASSSISFIVRDMAHVNDYNIFQCIYAVLLFGEASSNGGLKYRLDDSVINEIEKELRHIPEKPKQKGKRGSSPKRDSKKSLQTFDSPKKEDEVEFNENTGNIYDAISLQLLDLMYALHTNASGILGNMQWNDYQDKQQAELKARWSSKESIDQLPSTFKADSDNAMSLLWVKCWCPLLQGIARLCCDTRRGIRMTALTVLQRSMLADDLQLMSAAEWENCFNQVLFPMLSNLLELSTDWDPNGLEETRMRAATLLCKAFLLHLNTLISLATFTALWMTMLDFMDKYMHADNSDLLFEAVPESLKNMLLVMSTAGIFEHHQDIPENENPDKKTRRYSALWQVTWDRIDCFLPNLKDDLLATRSPASLRASSPPEPDVPRLMTIHNLEDGDSVQILRTHSPEQNIESSSSLKVGSVSLTKPLLDIVSTPASSPVSQRASSPLLTDEPSGLNVQLFTPLPLISPPGSVHAVSETTNVHPVAILLPPIAMLELSPNDRKEESSKKILFNDGNTDVRAVFDI
ncbi:Golgi-specific brefeldin A-resistance guanine nucleotide exchange factor 1 isoform X4 [Hydra vulgaris]|uniref:Golgi-specific brefeldin A-resistance guanine nucleotide exchange factor 1 isoform X4 n=1 Tax=Hydra vulgaris TaxID=6087 RepID=A0ABM4BTL1_HYDVU